MKEDEEELKIAVQSLVRDWFETYHAFIKLNENFNKLDNDAKKANVILNSITHFTTFFIYEILKNNIDDDEIIEKGKVMIDDIFNLFKRVYVCKKINVMDKH